MQTTPESQLNSELKHVTLWLSANKLTLNVTKTEFMLTTTRQKLPFLAIQEIRIQIDISIEEFLA